MGGFDERAAIFLTSKPLFGNRTGDKIIKKVKICIVNYEKDSLKNLEL